MVLQQLKRQARALKNIRNFFDDDHIIWHEIDAEIDVTYMIIEELEEAMEKLK